MSLPETKLLLRGKECGIKLFDGPPSAAPADPCSLAPDASSSGATINGRTVEYSADGRLLAVVGSEGVTVRGGVDGSVVAELTSETLGSGAVDKLGFSPLGTYLVTWQKPNAEVHPDGNLKVWSTSSAALVKCFHVKHLKRSAWPNVQWTGDEAIAMHMVTNEVQIYHGQHLEQGFIEKIRLPSVASLAVSPSVTLPYKCALFVPEAKGKPAQCRIFSYPQVGASLAAKSFYNAEEWEVMWAPSGLAVLVKTHTSVDTTGSSYYGSTGLFLLHAEADGFDCTVPLGKEGPVSDAQWSPAGRHFIVVGGTMPALATLYNLKAEAIFSFGQAHRNTISWSPHGRFVALAGFGNLAGEIDFWDVNKKKRMGATTSHCAVGYGWAPDGRHFMTATTAPRMNVDNGVKIFTYTGTGPIATLEVGELFEAQWMPAAKDVYPDRPQSPGRVGPSAGGDGAGGGGQGRGAGARTAPGPAKPQAYRAPGSSGGLAAMMRAEREGGGAQRLPPGGIPGAGHVPGMAPAAANSAANKNKARKEARRKAKDAEEEAKVMLGQSEGATGAPAPPAAAAEPAAEDPAKRKKKLMKQLKAIEELKAKGGERNEDQRAKLATEAQVREELASLEI